MRYWYDCEFLEDGKTIEPISIGIVAEDGREYYAVNAGAPWKRIEKHEWLMANVVPHLPRGHGDWRNHMPRSWLIDFHDLDVKPPKVIADEVRRFIEAGSHDRERNELWAYYGAYDHVALCRLWGRMVDLPAAVPMWTHDLMQLAAGRPLPPQTSGEHHALADARWNRDMYLHLTGDAA